MTNIRGQTFNIFDILTYGVMICVFMLAKFEMLSIKRDFFNVRTKISPEMTISVFMMSILHFFLCYQL